MDIKSRSSGHQVRRYCINGDDSHVITFGWDGLVFVKNSETLQSFAVFNSHHRFTYGVKIAVIDRTCAVSYTHLDVYKRQSKKWTINTHPLKTIQ